VEINQDNARRGNQLIAEAVQGDCGQIIDRQQDYSIPVEVFPILNANPRLRAIAVVVHRESSLRAAEIDRRFFNKPLAVFTSVAEARDWLEQALSGSAPPG
jgi:hypothetical protein